MILANLAKAVREQNYYAVVLEFVIVIAGVVIGFQINAWSAGQQERREVQALLAGLAADVQLAERLAADTLDARLDRVGHLVSAWRQIDNPDITDMGPAECLAVAASHHFGLTIANLTSLQEIVASGRLGILGDDQLRAALSRYEQATDNLREMLQRYPVNAANITRNHPDLVRISPVISDVTGRVGYHGTCDIEAMRGDTDFINALTENIDLYDYFVATGLRPWEQALTEVRIHLERRQSGTGTTP